MDLEGNSHRQLNNATNIILKKDYESADEKNNMKLLGTCVKYEDDEENYDTGHDYMKDIKDIVNGTYTDKNLYEKVDLPEKSVNIKEDSPDEMQADENRQVQSAKPGTGIGVCLSDSCIKKCDASVEYASDTPARFCGDSSQCDTGELNDTDKHQSDVQPSTDQEIKCKSNEDEDNNESALTEGLRATRGPSTTYNCEQCDESFTNKNHLKMHIASHPGLHQHPCLYCDKSFRTDSSLKTHHRIHKRDGLITEPEKLDCQICGKVFDFPSQITIHMRSHLDSMGLSSRYTFIYILEKLHIHVQSVRILLEEEIC